MAGDERVEGNVLVKGEAGHTYASGYTQTYMTCKVTKVLLSCTCCKPWRVPTIATWLSTTGASLTADSAEQTHYALNLNHCRMPRAAGPQMPWHFVASPVLSP